MTRSDITIELTKALRRVSPGFMQIVKLTDSGGSFEEFKDGKTVSSKFTYHVDGNTVVLDSPTQVEGVNAVTAAESHDSFDDAIIALRTAAASPTDRLAIANAKDAADRERLRLLALDVSAQQLADNEREYERKAIIDEAKIRAAAELNVPVHELILVERDDDAPDVSYAPVDGYGPALKVLRERERR